MKKLFIIAAAAVSLVAVAIPATASAGVEKIGVCHLDGTGRYQLIEIGEPAYDSHVAHGDDKPGEAVPNMPGFVFAEDCIPTEVQERTMEQVCADLIEQTGTGQFVEIRLNSGEVVGLRCRAVFGLTFEEYNVAAAEWSEACTTESPDGTAASSYKPGGVFGEPSVANFRCVF